MPNIKKFNEVQPRARLVTGLKTSLLLAPFAMTGAFAQTGDPIAAMGTTASTGADTVQSTIVKIAGVVVVIGLLIWGATKLKPRG